MNISAISTTNEVKKYNKEIQLSNNTDANANENKIKTPVGDSVAYVFLLLSQTYFILQQIWTSSSSTYLINESYNVN